MTGTSFDLRKALMSLCMTISILVACGAAPVAGGGAQTRVQDRSAYQATTLIRRWRVIINTTFEERRASAQEPIMDSIEVAISPGAVKAVQDRATEQRLKTIDAAVQRFANAMVGAGERLPDGSVAISEDAIYAALKAICPVYPFC